ncbi:MAG: cytochrome c oxidase assembly protein [Rhodospirillales bacterium]|nr:cytochrome c oxidase assembly protein [Rhodospirillales bacterium]MBO6785669.1 cytochrome c oxidase assembly protein [Rhodospirillales bacterium]
MANVRNKNVRTAMVLFTVVAGMVGLSFASVPLYRIFCQVTGLGGTPGVAAEAPATATDTEFVVRFDANTNPQLPWRFKPVQREVRLKLGEEKLAFYQATNLSDKPVTGSATFNVTPLKAGQFFVKIDCFCFTEQTLMPGETVDMPVTFYVDPEIYEEVNTRDVNTITLSYTFYPKEEGDKVSAVRQLAKPGEKG